MSEAGEAFRQALGRVPRHPLASLALGMIAPDGPGTAPGVPGPSFEAAIGQAIVLAGAGDPVSAARRIDQTLSAVPPGNAGWQIPVEPMLNVASALDAWAPVLARLRTRAA